MTGLSSSELQAVRASMRLSIARHGAAGWRWTMLLEQIAVDRNGRPGYAPASRDSAFSAAVEFRSGEDGRGTWMRLIGDTDWQLVSPPDQRTYPTDEDEARLEIEQVCIAAAANLIRSFRAPPPGNDLAWMLPAGHC